MTPPRPRVLLLNVPRLLRDILHAALRQHADVGEATVASASVWAANVPSTSYELVIACDDPSEETCALLRDVLALQTRTRYLGLRRDGARATRYTLESRAEPIDVLTSERLVAEVTAVPPPSPPRPPEDAA